MWPLVMYSNYFVQDKYPIFKQEAAKKAEVC